MINHLIEGALLGLTLGASCLITCGPVYASLIMQKEHSVRSATKTVLYLSLGRFLSYSLFGIGAGLLGSVVNDYIETETFVIISYILLAIYLIYSAFQQGKHEKNGCPAVKLSKFTGNPFLIGVITGISICPSFLGALTRSFDLGGALGGMMLFVGFFAGTTLYLLPMGALSYFTRKRIFRLIAIFASILVSLWFLYLAGEKIYDKATSFVFNFTEESVYVVNISGFKEDDGTSSFFKVKEHISASQKQLETVLDSIPVNSKVLLVTSEIPDEKTKDLFRKKNLHGAYIYSESFGNMDMKSSHEFLKSYDFKGRKTRGFLYRVP